MKPRPSHLRGGLDVPDWQGQIFDAFEWQGKPVKVKTRLPIKTPPKPISEADRSAFWSVLSSYFSPVQVKRFYTASFRRFAVDFSDHESAYFAALEEIWCRFEGGANFDLSRLGGFVRVSVNQHLKDILRASMCRRAMERKASPFREAALSEARSHSFKDSVRDRACLDAAHRVQFLRRWFFEAGECERKAVAALVVSDDSGPEELGRLVGWRDPKDGMKRLRKALRQVLYEAGYPVPGALKRSSSGSVHLGRSGRVLFSKGSCDAA